MLATTPKSLWGLAALGSRAFSSTAARSSLAAVEKLAREMMGRVARPWDNPATEDEAAAALGAFWGVPEIKPGDVLDLGVDQMEAILAATTLAAGNPALEAALFKHSEGVTRRFFGADVYFRGIVEFSNVCENDCGYCGIRKHQPRTWRYTMPAEEVVAVAEWALEHGMGTLMLQSGQLSTGERNSYIEDVVRRVRARTVAMDLQRRQQAATLSTPSPSSSPPSASPSSPPSPSSSELGLCVALSVGELPLQQYRAFREAGAARYLLRIETSNPDLYAALHPPAQSWEARVRALEDLKVAGFQVGTGVMVGLPGQTLRDLAGDVAFFKSVGADMIGMGPYITETGTPVAAAWQQQYGGRDKKAHMAAMLALTTRVNALARVTLGNVNIAATTALQAIDPMGRELALRRGANILMPILTPTKYRQHYTLYEGKPCITDTADECQKCLSARLSMVEKKLRPGIWGDPPSFGGRIRTVPMRGAGVGAVAGSSDTAGGQGLHTTARAQQQMSQQPVPLPSGAKCDVCGHPAAPQAPSCAVTTKEGFAAAARANGPAPFASGQRGSDVPRVNIGIFGRMNAGKSTLMNRLARSNVSIVDATPGTTADTKVLLMELHAAGPVKLLDTAGVDESGQLGEKKRRKVLSVVKECDVAVVVVDLEQTAAAAAAGGDELSAALEWERLLLERAAAAGAMSLLVFNRRAPGGGDALQRHVAEVLDPAGQLATLSATLTDPSCTDAITDFVQRWAAEAGAAHDVPSLPSRVLAEGAMVWLNIPMDAETPTLRLLRPQALVQEEAIRHYATTLAYRMNLAHARSSDPAVVERERRRFLAALQPALDHPGPVLVVTDSQAVDVVHPWTLDPATGHPLVPFTTFSIAMIQRQSRGALPTFVAGIEAFRRLRPGDRVLVAEACNHNRITQLCNDIGVVQIPQKLQAAAGGGVIVEHAFGREFPELEGYEGEGLKLSRFALAVHCGGCMVDSQKIRARVSDLREAGVPVTNYGLLLAYAHSPSAMRRALEPWGLSFD